MRNTIKRLFAAALPIICAVAACDDGTAEDAAADAQELGAVRLHYSLSPNRANPLALASASLRGPVYIFTSPSSGVAKVDFYLDDPDRERAPISVDEASPYDFAGTAAEGSALPFDLSTLSDGTHSLRAQARGTDGKWRSANVQFEVTGGNGAPPPVPDSGSPVPDGSPPPVGACSGVLSSPGGPDSWGACWPGPSNTGVPAGTTLTPYTGPCTITTAGTVIDAKTVSCILSIRAANVTITRSQINGGVDVPSAAPADASFVISDSSIHVGDNLNTGLMRRNFHANRVNITGGRRSVYCASNCVIENSWVHAQGGDPDGEAHFSGIRMEQRTTVRHNSITCEANRHAASGCSAGLTGYGDFAPVQNNLIERNFFYRGGGGGSTTCAYGGSSGDDGGKPYGHLAENIRFIGNRFVRSPTGHCGNIRTIISFNPSRPGNAWTDNLFHDGAVVNATGP